MTLTTRVTEIPLVGPAFETRLERLGIKTVKDLLWHIPSRYEDFSLLATANSLQEGEIVTVQGKVLEIKNIFTKTGFNLQQAKIEDATGITEALWFNQRFLTNALHKNDFASFSGKVKRTGAKVHLESPQYEILYGTNKTFIHTGRLVPIYPETDGISSKWLRGRIYQLLTQLEIDDYLPNQTMSLSEALHEVHFPTTLELAKKARERLAFDELLFSQLESKQRKTDWQDNLVGSSFKPVDLTSFKRTLPFTLTTAQERAASEILSDLTKKTPMNRLLQGDVGSGKTVVAALALLTAVQNGFQAVLMAPTEILANQHFATLETLLAPHKIKLGIATGSKKDYAGSDIIIGTHALLSESLTLNNLGLIIIDEQHRFGVGQRAKLNAKGKNPHVLTMTATPIPRTIALTLYGDLDVSVIDELPKDRLPIKTWVVPEEKRAAAYAWIKNQNTQSFIVCPLIDESEAETLTDVKAVKKEYTRLQKEVFPDLKLGLLHGQMKPEEKAKVLAAFKAKKTDILVATPVVEVGIDIPNATIMVIEAADRFGLAGLHQLRGRVGRGDKQSYCLLFSDNPSSTGRLKYLETLNNGLKLAEVDLKFRGPGQRFGLSQHGKSGLKIADFSDLDLVERSSSLADQVLKTPKDFPLLLKLIRESKIDIVQN